MIKKCLVEADNSALKGVLQNASFAALLFLLFGSFFCCVLRVKEWFWVYLGHGKADREDSHGLAVEFFLSFICYAAFFSE